MNFFHRWQDVEDEERTVDTENRTEVRKFATKLYRTTIEYTKTLRELQDTQLEIIK